MKEIKIEGLSIENFYSFLEGSDIKNKQIIEFMKDGYCVKAHPSDKSYAIYKRTKEPINSKNEFDKILIPLMSYAKLLSVIKFYNSLKIKTVDVKINCVEENKQLVAASMQFSSKKSNTKVPATDMVLMSFITDEIWKVIVDESTKLAEFSLSVDEVEHIKKLSEIYKKNKKETNFKISIKGGSLIISGKDGSDWSMELEGDSDISSTLKDQSFVSPLVGLEFTSGKLPIRAVIKTSPKGIPMLLLIESEDSVLMNSLLKE